MHKTGYLRSLGVDPGSGISRLLNSAGIELGTRLLYIDAFLASLLADREAQSRDYLLTRLLAKMAYEQSSADGFFYPSVEDHNGMNIAMLPEAYSSHTHAVCCQFVRVTKVREFGFFEYEVILDSTGITDAWGIKWKQPIAKHSTAFFGLTESELSFLRRHPESNGNSFLELVGLGQSDG